MERWEGPRKGAVRQGEWAGVIFKITQTVRPTAGERQCQGGGRPVKSSTWNNWGCAVAGQGRSVGLTMQLPVLFWVIYIISLLFSLWSHWPLGPTNARPFGGWIVLFILIGLLGWEVFGSAVKK